MKYFRISLFILLATALALPAVAEEVRPTAQPQSADAYSKTAISGIEAGISFIRLTNLGDQATRNSVEIYGLTDKVALGSFVVDVPAKATVQFQPELMIQTFAAVNWRQPIVLYVGNGRDKQVWQHIKIDSRSGTFLDASVCASPPTLNYVPPGNAAINVFPGGSSRFVSTVTLHNFGDRSGRFEAWVYNATTGERVGGLGFELGARQSFTKTGLFYAALADWFVPVDDVRHMNVEFVQAGDSGARIVVGHQVLDLLNGATLNLSNPCAIHGGHESIP